MIALRNRDSQKDILPLPRKTLRLGSFGDVPFRHRHSLCEDRKTGVTDDAPHLYHLLCIILAHNAHTVNRELLLYRRFSNSNLSLCYTTRRRECIHAFRKHKNTHIC